LPLAAAIGLTFSYNVTIGIPVYIEIAKAVMRVFPILPTPALQTRQELALSP
jgi:hypothetical protein